MSIQKFNGMARTVSTRAPVVMQAHGLEPRFLRRIVFVEERDLTLLFLVLDANRILRSGQRLYPYTAPGVLHDLSTMLGGKRVLLSNTDGLRYAIVLRNRQPRLPQSVEFPGHQRGEVLIGVSRDQHPIALPWEQLGNVLVGGMTRFGKSTFLRLVVHQVLSEGFKLAICDLQSRTFPMLRDHPALIAPMPKEPDEAAGVLNAVLGEIKRREALFDEQAKHGHYPSNLDAYNALPSVEQLPRLVVVLDEFNDTVLATGGPNGDFARNATRIAWAGLKWGVHMVVAGHEFARKIVGPVAGQMNTRLCFRVEHAPTSNIVIGHTGATKLTRPGRAILRGRGMMQAFLVEEDVLIDAASSPALTAKERQIALFIRDEKESKLNRANLKAAGLSQRQADDLIRDWQARGWATTGEGMDRTIRLTPVILEMIAQESRANY